MYKKLLDTVTKLGSPKVLVAGDFMLDVYVYGDALRISPEAPVPVLKVRRTEYNCGGASSVVKDLATLGAKPFCLGVIGEDENGQRLLAKLKKSGAEVSGLREVSDRPTISKQRLIGLAQHRHQQQLFRIDEEVTDALSEEVYKELEKIYSELIKESEVLCLQDYNKGFLKESFCKDMIFHAKEAGKKIVVDPSMGGDYSKFKGASIITPNRQEASLAAGFDLDSKESIERAGDFLFEELEVEAVLITLDKEGVYLKTVESNEFIPTRPRSVYDVTGAGDMVLAMLSAALGAGCEYKAAAQLCNIAGGIEVEKFGVATVTVDEIVNEIITESRGKEGKLRSSESLKGQLDYHRSQGEKIVFTNGCFDVIHRGHIEFLKFCKGQGDVLFVGLNSDGSVRSIKGPERPINNQYDRASVLAAMESVDYITIFESDEPLELIREVKPDILVKGEDWADKVVVGQEFVESYGGKVVLAPLVEGKSTSSVIEKITKLWKSI